MIYNSLFLIYDFVIHIFSIAPRYIRSLGGRSHLRLQTYFRMKYKDTKLKASIYHIMPVDKIHVVLKNKTKLSMSTTNL